MPSNNRHIFVSRSIGSLAKVGFYCCIVPLYCEEFAVDTVSISDTMKSIQVANTSKK